MAESAEAASANEVEAGWGDKKVRIRGSDWLGLINMLALGIALYGGFDHVMAAKEGQKAVVEAVKEQAQATTQMVRALQEANCLNRLTPEQKKSATELEWCRKIGKGQAF